MPGSGDKPRGEGRPRPPFRGRPGAGPEPGLLPRMLAGIRAEVGPVEQGPPPPDAQHWIKKLGLRAHPEGGYYRETYRAAETLGVGQLPDRFDGPRAMSTAILFLLEGQQRSLVHRLRSDEVWHFYAGDPLVLFLFEAAGDLRRVVLGRDLDAGQVFQAAVPAGTWFGAALAEGGAYVLAGCTVAPGFDFADLELGDRRALMEQFPRHQLTIKRLTR